jgi:hypothetical protein
MYSVHCAGCRTTYFVSHSDQSFTDIASDGSSSTRRVREYDSDALSQPHLRVGQRVLIMTDVCHLADRVVYYGRGSIQSIAHIISSGDGLPSDDLR